MPKEISLVGRLDRPILLETLAQADLLLYLSDFEGFGFPLIEAMAFGTTVVSFPGNAECEVGGEFAIFTEKPDLSSLNKALDQALERIRDLVWQDDLRQYALGFTWDDSIRIHREVLESILA